MTDEIKKCLYDIKTAIESINIHLKGDLNFDAYRSDITVKRAVEREFEIIGEAVNRILIEDDSVQISDSRKIIALRNRIIHGYDTIDDAVIWNVIIANLPKLKGEVDALLSE
jgi:uncharacterized protein with HEPN domain